MNADYENQGILPRTCTCDSIKVRGKGKRSYAFSEDFEDKSVLKTLTSWREDIHLYVESWFQICTNPRIGTSEESNYV